MADLHECHFDNKCTDSLIFYCVMSRLEALAVEFGIIYCGDKCTHGTYVTVTLPTLSYK